MAPNPRHIVASTVLLLCLSSLIFAQHPDSQDADEGLPVNVETRTADAQGDLKELPPVLARLKRSGSAAQMRLPRQVEANSSSESSRTLPSSADLVLGYQQDVEANSSSEASRTLPSSADLVLGDQRDVEANSSSEASRTLPSSADLVLGDQRDVEANSSSEASRTLPSSADLVLGDQRDVEANSSSEASRTLPSSAELVLGDQRDVDANSSSEASRTLPSSADLSEVRETLSLLKSGETNIVFGDKRDVVLVLGVTGSGKSTLTQFIAGDIEALVATRTNGVLLISDGNQRIATSTITSKTIFPEYVFGPKTGTAFYDCPGFSDTRSPSHDIGASYFIKQVFDHAQRVKMLFTISASALVSGNDREGFVNLLTYACTLIADIDKFANNILVVVTKVNNDYRYDDEDVLTLIPDNVVIENIAGFMRDARATLMERFNSKDIANKKSSSNSCDIKLIDIFTTTVGDWYTRIGIFRRPVRAGPLSKSPLLVSGKENIETILSQHTKYTAKNKDDFTYTISDSSKYYITNSLNRILNAEITASLTGLGNDIEKKLVDECTRSTDMYELQLQLDAVDNSLGRLTADNTFKTPAEFIANVAKSMVTIGVNVEDILRNVTREIGYLEVFQGFSKSKGKYFSTVLGSQTFFPARDFARNLNSWYLLLLDLFNKHSNYPYQKLSHRYNANDLIHGEIAIDLHASNVHTFLEQVANNSVHHSVCIVDDERMSSVSLRDLNNVMNLAYNQYVSSCLEMLEAALDQLAKQIKTEYLQKCKVYSISDIRELQQVLRVASDSLLRITQTTFTTADSFYIELGQTLGDVSISGQSALSHLEHLIKHQRLYENFTARDSGSYHFKPEVWSSLLKPAAEYINDLGSWYQHILSVHADLVKINAGQNETPWVKTPGVPIINEKNMVKFMLNIQLPKYDRLLNDTSTVQVVLRDLNNIAHYTSALVASSHYAVIADLEIMYDSVKAKYKLQCHKSNDMYSLNTSLALGYNTIRELVETNHTNAIEFINKLFNSLQDMGVTGNRDMLPRITKTILNLQYLLRYSLEETEHFNFSKWTGVFFPAKDYMSNLSNWYSLLLDLHRKLSQYSVQRDTTKYNVNWGIDERNVHTFLQKVDNRTLAGFELMIACKNEELAYKGLNRVLDLTLKHPAMAFERVKGELTIEGQFVVVSKFSELLNPVKYKSVRVFALDTVFIDADVKRVGDEFQLTIIASTWDVQGSRDIVLRGAPGLNHGLYKAKGDREDGKPGNPGYPGGTFFGVGHVFNRGRNLTVSSIGGAGGQGQHGGDGHDGIRRPELNHTETLNEVCSVGFHNTPDNFEFVNTTWKYVVYLATYVKVHPIGVGTIGGNGGHGGKGGMGGHAGKINIVSLDGGSQVRSDTHRGSMGMSGLGGKGGKGGYTAKPLLVYIRTEAPWRDPLQFLWCTGVVTELRGEDLPPGSRGNDNSNTRGWQSLVSEKEMPTFKSINLFKSYAWSNLKNVVIFSRLTLFLESLSRNVDLRSTYDVLGYVDELNYLESANTQINSNVDLTVYYRHILESLDSYFQTALQMSSENKSVLQFVYTAALSRVCRMRARADRSLITDLSRFLEQAKSNLPKLADLKAYQEIDHINANFKNAIELKIKEANNFVKNHTLIEIDKVVGEIETNIQALEKETKTLQQNARGHRDAILEHERKLQGKLIMKSIFSMLKLASSVMPMIGSATLDVVAPLLGAATDFAESVAGLDEAEAPTPPNIFQGLKYIIREIETNKIHNTQERKLVNAVTLTDTIVREIGANYSQFDKLRARVVAIKSNLADGATGSLATVRDALYQAMGSAREELKPDDVQGKVKLDTITALLAKSEDPLTTLAKYHARSGAESGGSAEVKAAEKTIKELEMYEEQIHATLVPLLKNMHQSLTSIESKLADQSHVYLDVSRWQVQKSIRNVKHIIQQATRGFHAGHKLERTISKLEEVADLIINLYNRIETYQDQKRLGDLVSSIAKVNGQGSPVRDPMLRTAVTELQVTITSNTIITQCTRALNAFKQQIFPFVGSYLHLLNDELSMDGKANTSALVDRAVEKLQSLISAVSETKTSVQNHRDSKVITKAYNSNHLTSQPFFTWGNQTFNEELINLLSGKEVVLKANLPTGPNSENAVKFSLINLNLRATSERLQVELDEVIKHFDIELRHFGNSHYRCGGEFYAISGDSQTIKYSFERNNSTGVTPIRSNQVYKKIKDGDISLSPYAMWSLKLGSETSSFEALSRFKGNIHLELVGEGQYVEANVAECRGSLADYYDVYQG